MYTAFILVLTVSNQIRLSLTKSNMSMTLPRWFGRKTQKKIDRKNEDSQEEKAKSHKSSKTARESVDGPVSYFQDKDRDDQNEDGTVLHVGTLRQQKEKSEYVQEQQTRSNQVTGHVFGGETLVNREVEGARINYENSESTLSTYPFGEPDLDKKTNHIMSPTIYGGR